MQKSALTLLVDCLIMILMLFGWIAMLSDGFGGTEQGHGEGSGTSDMSRFNPLRYGFYIFGIATLALVFISKRREINERIFMGITIFGLFSLCQPFILALYRYGFQTLLVGTLAFIIISHIKTDRQSVT